MRRSSGSSRSTGVGSLFKNQEVPGCWDALQESGGLRVLGRSSGIRRSRSVGTLLTKEAGEGEQEDDYDRTTADVPPKEVEG